MSHLKRLKRPFTIPAEAAPLIERRMASLGMTWGQYVSSLISYDCWAEKPHLLTGDSIRAGRAEEQRLWEEIIADEGKPDKTGSFFEHRAAEFVLSKSGKKDIEKT